jgi:rubrerythrin
MERPGVFTLGLPLGGAGGCGAIRRGARDEFPVVNFDIADYKRRAERLRWDDLDFASFVDRPLDADTLRCIEYMHDVELHTICYLRDLLVTSAHNDPDVTAFLSCWAYEEMWHGEALAAVLEAHGRPAGEARVGPLRRRLGVRDRVRPLLSALGSWTAGERIIALHMTWGAVNEWTTQAGYVRLAQRAKHPVLSELTRRIARQEGRHIDFYVAEARRRLAESPGAQKVVRWALRRLWRPVGSGIMEPADTDFLIAHLFGGADGVAFTERIDRRIDRLPGLEGLGLVHGAVTARAA